ncbi:MAG TPA: phosphoenolpyruvate--protein phosphotransferase [Spirochaetota bacterium]|nr:phosphoenolpyruvate--protein phosphotransferase [Spirochaetota bacterium]HOS32701.1 phosphoenolpyruvate--protein phosphotransferase [Spirochaetota bacterium]HOS55857.1 phosphoenolpyruvate--protein phosphotransferase [Spirochaetota bacterium]HPK61846.1 phosphoenolpyruvate--protein phosphotransferase [Spirochaetota bacterium]HQF78432.1 phosphoenolpyruvate--protein phosphotransferase [Spirochaetota bacterium]
MEILEGISASHGIAIGEALVYNQEISIKKYSINDLQVELEIDRFYKALVKVKEDYIVLRNKLVSEMSEDEGKFLDAHILMTEDATFINQVLDYIRESKKNIEWVIYQVVENLSKKFSELDDEYFQDRATDILDIGRKIMRVLLSQKSMSLSDLNNDVVIISADLTVSDTASMNKNRVLAFVTEIGGKTSHSAILARSLGIPSVVGIKDVSHIANTGDLIIVDGNSGKIIINPDDEKLEYYTNLRKKLEKRENEFLQFKDISSKTLDNRSIVLKANMEIPEQEIENVIKFGAEGIGLYRSEFLYLSKKRRLLPSEEQQFNAYKFILEKMGDKPVTIRTLDLGGDKLIEGVTKQESNPYLGWRAIRFCLDRPDIFKIQLRALLRASVYGNLSIMLPMITTLEEVTKTKRIITEVKRGLKRDGFKYKDNIPLGIMIETPSAVMISDILAKKCNFFSIGTNDLIQYTMACDRGNQNVGNLYQPLHPAVLRLIKKTIDNAHKENIKVGVCGEMVSEIQNAIVLIGLGVDELSLSSIGLLEIKKAILNIKYSDAKKIAEEALRRSSKEGTEKKINLWMKKNLKYLY